MCSDVYQSASFLSTNTDDDDISVFVQDIDARKPLGSFGIAQEQSQDGQEHDRARIEEHPTNRGRTFTDEELSRRERTAPASPFVDSEASAAAEMDTGGMLTSQIALDVRLRQMNAAFRASLVGMVRTGGRERGSAGEDRGARAREARSPAPSMGRAASLSAAARIVPNAGSAAHRPRIRSGIEMARRAASASDGGTRPKSGSGYGVGSGSGSGSGSSPSGSGLLYERRGSAAGSTGSEEVMGRLEL